MMAKKVKNTVQTIIAILVTLIMFFPLYWMLNTSLKGESEVITTIPTFWPETLRVDNWLHAWNAVDFSRYIFNTLWVTFWQIFLSLLTSVLAAYAFARGKFPFKNFLFMVVLSAMCIPDQATFIPIYVLISDLGWINTFAGLIFPDMVSAYMIFMLRQNFMSVDQSFIDAGKIDGLGIFGTIYHILMPMCKGSVAVVCMNSFINGWNNYFWPKILARDDATRPIAIAIVKLKQMFDDVSTASSGYYNVVMAGVLISIIPVVVVFAFNQKHMLDGYSKNAMK